MAILQLEDSVLTLSKGRRLAMFIATWTLMLRAREEVPTEATMLEYHTSRRDADDNTPANLWLCTTLHATTLHVNLKTYITWKTWKYAGLLLSHKQVQAIRYQDNVPHLKFLLWTTVIAKDMLSSLLFTKYESTSIQSRLVWFNYFNASWQQWHIVGLWQQRCSVDPNII
jgi:hypothetical protein